ncbi:MAG TPA: 2-C-methyl-D-erythritol 2,4-cyclodiphosphate synthase, partial [Gemmataceae bacterium]|nr:2-C-methyl-D-erythritol 2,4-cyclodiphosphate synthase [Gemmataceae bacterium]
GTLKRLAQAGWSVVNVDVTIFAQEPKLGPIKPQIREQLAKLLGVATDAVNVKAKTGERLGHIGRAEALACQAVALIEQMNNKPKEPKVEKAAQPTVQQPEPPAKQRKKPVAAKAAKKAK